MTLSNSSWIQISSLHSYCKAKDIYKYIYSYKIVRAFASNYAKKKGSILHIQVSNYSYQSS